MLLTVPHGVVAGVAERFGLVAMPCPIAIEPISLALYRSRQLQRDDASTWFAERVAAALDTTFGTQDASAPALR